MSRLGPAKSERDRRECQILWTGSGNGQRLQRTSCQSRGGKGKGKTPPPAASKEPHAAANCRRTQPRRSLRVGASGGGVGSVVGAPVGASVCVQWTLRTNCATRKNRSVHCGAHESPSSRNSAIWGLMRNLVNFVGFYVCCQYVGMCQS